MEMDVFWGIVVAVYAMELIGWHAAVIFLAIGIWAAGDGGPRGGSRW
jgi:hypothetical protein